MAISNDRGNQFNCDTFINKSNATSQQTFVSLQDIFKTCLEDVFNTSSV